MSFADYADDPRFAGLTRLTKRKLAKLRKEHPNLPADYVAWLEQVGYGTATGVPTYSIYGGLMDPRAIYNPPSPDVSRLLIFGDDYMGYCNGFDPEKGWRVVEVEPGGDRFERDAASFTAFVRKKWGKRVKRR